jgi:hypothetical protein
VDKTAAGVHFATAKWFGGVAKVFCNTLFLYVLFAVVFTRAFLSPPKAAPSLSKARHQFFVSLVPERKKLCKLHVIGCVLFNFALNTESPDSADAIIFLCRQFFL